MNSSTRGEKTKTLTKIDLKCCYAYGWSVIDHKKSLFTFKYRN